MAPTFEFPPRDQGQEAIKKELKQLEGDRRSALMEQLEQLTEQLPEPLASICSVKNDTWPGNSSTAAGGSNQAIA